MSPRTASQNEIIRRQRMMAIQQAALDLFAYKGYVNTSISDIAKTANISKGLMYNYFSSKEQLLEAILQNAFEISEGIMNPITDKSIPPTERLINLIKTTLSLYQTNTAYLKLLYSLFLQAEIMERFADSIGEHTVYKTELSIALFTELGSQQPHLEAMQLGAQLSGIFLHYTQMKEAYPMAAMQDLVIRTFVKNRSKDLSNI